MKKNERGILTIEASLVLTFLIMFVLFIFSFARVYQAQSVVSHAVIQTADAIALESYLRETAFEGSISDVLESANKVTGSTSLSEDSFESLRSADLPKLAREKFIVAIAKNQAETEAKLQKLGIKDGIAGIDFTECQMDLKNDDVIVAVSYTIKMQFAVLGYDEIKVTKSAKAKTFGEILFQVSTSVNKPGWGTTNGDTKVTYGSNVTITANANYGYKFVKWSDGSTEPTRTVNVTDAQHYEAIFEKDKFGVNLSTSVKYDTSVKDRGFNHTNYGSVSGAGTYLYLDTVTITATPTEHYVFSGWDDNGDGRIDNTNATRQITVDKTYSLKAIFVPKKYTITVNVNNNQFGTASVQQGSKSGSSISVEYGSSVKLAASSKDTILYKFTGWTHGVSSATTNARVTGAKTYTANFERNTYTVNFYNGTTYLASATAIVNTSINGSRAYLSTGMPGNPSMSGAHFDGWRYNGNTFTGDTKVKGNINVYAAWYCKVTLNGNGGNDAGEHKVSKGGSFNFSAHSTHRNGHNFTGWYNGNRYDGWVTINSDITVYASWACRHADDNGASWYQPISGSATLSCSGSTITYRCWNCGHQYSVHGSGACDDDARCGKAGHHDWGSYIGPFGCYAPGYATSHGWRYFECQTCTGCGKIIDPVDYKKVGTVSDVQWCFNYGHEKRANADRVNTHSH